MTEAEWLGCDDAWLMIEFLKHARADGGGYAGGRKYRLFGCACVRRGWHLLDDERSRAAVVIAEQFADGAVTRKQLMEGGAREGADSARNEGAGWAGAARKLLLRSSRMAGSAVVGNDPLQPALLRDIIGNPFSQVAIDPAVLTPVVATLAQAVYDERPLPSGEFDPARMAVLADALEEAGAGGDLLEHLRGPGPHVRGCWAVDLCLGKS